MSAQALLLGVINIGVYAVILILVGLFVEWICRLCEKPLPAEIRKFYLILVLLIVLGMVVALLFGLQMPMRVF